LSTGAKIGIGVCIPVIVLAGLLIGFFLLRSRKARKPPPYEHEGSPDYTLAAQQEPKSVSAYGQNPNVDVNDLPEFVPQGQGRS